VSQDIDFSESFSEDGVESFVFRGQKRELALEFVDLNGTGFKFSDSVSQEVNFSESFGEDRVDSVSFLDERVYLPSHSPP